MRCPRCCLHYCPHYDRTPAVQPKTQCSTASAKNERTGLRSGLTRHTNDVICCNLGINEFTLWGEPVVYSSPCLCGVMYALCSHCDFHKARLRLRFGFLAEVTAHLNISQLSQMCILHLHLSSHFSGKHTRQRSARQCWSPLSVFSFFFCLCLHPRLIFPPRSIDGRQRCSNH